MTSDQTRIDDWLAAALREDVTDWPAASNGREAAIIERIAYHGIAGLLNAQVATVHGIPERVTAYLREQGLALAMWELRHQALLGEVLNRLADTGITPLLLKGTALAYDLYPTPATRARGDTDLLVGAADLAAARNVLLALGYRRAPLDDGIADDLALQEVWSRRCDAGTNHHIDLHWQLINAPALAGLLDFAACSTDPLALPRLHPSARAMSRPLTLLHSCIHRAMHLTSPYIVNGVTYYGGDRLIWARDIDLLARALSIAEWRGFSRAAIDNDVAEVCASGLDFARRMMSTPVPDAVTSILGERRGERASFYLLGAGQARRAWLDLHGIAGWRRKLAYIGARGLPSARFLRGKYPALAGRPLALLHLKRIVELVRARPGRSGG